MSANPFTTQASPEKSASVSAWPAIDAAIAAFQAGRPVIMMDDHSRENEADLIIPAEVIDESIMAMFIRECSGIVCLCMDDAWATRLALSPMVANNESRYATAFTVSIEARHGVTTGVSARDRVTTIRAAIAKHAQPEDIVRPGHVFPLRANPDGVLGRRGHTEGSTDLARLAGYRPLAVLCELMNPDGTMMRGEQLQLFSERQGFPIVSIDDLAGYRRALEC